MTDVFERNKRSPDCLSTYRVSQHVLELLEGEAHDAVTRHLETCDECAARVEEERRALTEAQYEAVPEKFREPRERRRKLWWATPQLTLGVVAAAVAVMTIANRSMVRVPPAAHRTESTRTKGALSLEVDVVRSGNVVMEDMPASQLRVESGDVLRLRVAGAGDLNAFRVEGREATGWVSYYQGMAREGGTLPITVEITDEGETVLRLTGCATLRDLETGSRCTVREFRMSRQR